VVALAISILIAVLHLAAITYAMLSSDESAGLLLVMLPVLELFLTGILGGLCVLIYMAQAIWNRSAESRSYAEPLSDCH